MIDNSCAETSHLIVLKLYILSILLSSYLAVWGWSSLFSLPCGDITDTILHRDYRCYYGRSALLLSPTHVDFTHPDLSLSSEVMQEILASSVVPRSVRKSHKNDETRSECTNSLRLCS